MTDRIDSFTVILQEDLRADDAQATIDAIEQLRGVLSVKPHIRSGLEYAVAETRVKSDLFAQITEILYPELTEKKRSGG